MLKQLFTSLSVKDVDIYLHFGEKLLDICVSFPEVILLQYLQRKAVGSENTQFYMTTDIVPTFAKYVFLSPSFSSEHP